MPLYQRNHIPLERFIQLIPDLVYIQEFPSKKIIFINRRFTDILGYDKDDLIQNDFSLDFAIERADMSFSLEKIEELLHFPEMTQMLEFNVSLKHKNGTCVLLRHRSMILKSEKPDTVCEILNIAEDITLLQKTNDLAIQQKNQLIEAEKIFKYGSWELLKDAQFVTWSDGLFEVFGYDKNDFENNNMEYGFYQKHIPLHERPQVIELSLEAVAKKKSFYEFEHSIIDGKGVLKHIAVKGKCYVDSEGNLLKVLGTSADITQLKKYENELQQKVEALFQSNQDLEIFAYTASHDLQEPLRKITAFGERLLARCANDLNDDGKFYINRIVEATNRMKLLIDNLLSYSRVSRQPIEAFSHVNLNQVINHVLSDLEIVIAQKQAMIRVEALPTIQGIVMSVHQLFQNLIANSLKFTQESIIPVIEIKAQKVPLEEAVTLNLHSQKVYWKITLQDNGIGFEEEFEEQIFGLFQRIHGNTAFEGTGLGLSICKRIVENHQGIIQAQGKVNQGAIFSIYLPEN
ncbi:ATP-binding protein [Flectobacillus major]|uniref:ATP-binding protein n=1 Tax=Flectobacillus major TaxID=103 RepID=UPI00042A069B|nr:ATP-binding protein [Flectobacillus major]